MQMSPKITSLKTLLLPKGLKMQKFISLTVFTTEYVLDTPRESKYPQMMLYTYFL